MTHERPYVSVIIPIYNDIARLKLCLEALEEQTYPNYEVLVVDNGSTDGDVAALCASFTKVRASAEEKVGSYPARNKGLSLAQGAIIAFTDSDCIPAPDWLEQGVARVLATPNCGLVAGHIEVFARDRAKPSLVELYDMMMAFPQERYVAKNRYGVTANLFTTRTVFETAGLFDASLKSGGDQEWGIRVAAAGFTLVYSAEARVAHPARKSFGELRKKARRVAGGSRDSNTTLEMLRRLKLLLYPPIGTSRRIFRDRSRGFSVPEKLTVVAMVSLWRLILAREILRSIIIRAPSTRS